MTELTTLPQGQVIRLVAQADKREFALFLGAGASRSSGVSLASEMIGEWRQMKFADAAPGEDFEAWCKEQSWFEAEDEYSVLFEDLFPNPRARQRYVEPKVEAAFPRWAYLYLANIVKAGYFNVVFTTNFDDLVNDALTLYLAYNPVVCAADSEVESISITTDRAKIVKLHGDYLFQRLKNTVTELEELDPNMSAKLAEFGKQCGMVVLGYAGRDRSVMRVLERVLADAAAFPPGIFWGVRPGDEPSTRLGELAAAYPERLRLFECPDFDGFMVKLHSALGLELPNAVLHPYETLRGTFERLVQATPTDQLADETIRAHVTELEAELDRPWAKTAQSGDLDLLQAQLALGRRDHATAIALVTKVVAEAPGNAAALTTWGDALAVQGEEAGDRAMLDESAAKWQEAIALDPELLPPRYSLVRYHVGRQDTVRAISESEELLTRAPGDSWLRRNLVNLYSTAGRHAEAQRLVDELVEREPGSADLRAMRANVLALRGLVPEATKEMRQAVSLSPDNAWFHFALANQLAQTGDGDEAATEFERAIALDHGSLSIRIQVANFYWMRQRPDLALPHLEQAVRIEPGSAEARGWLGQVYLALGRVADAQRETQAAIELSPVDVRPLVSAAIVSLHASDPAVAEGYLLKAVEVNPTNPQPYALLCPLYWSQNRRAESDWAMARLREIDPMFAQHVAFNLQSVRRGRPFVPQPFPAPPPAAGGQTSWDALARTALSKLVGGAGQPQ